MRDAPTTPPCASLTASREFAPKATRYLVPKGAVLELMTGGGGGYGKSIERTRDAVLKDLREGYISSEFAVRHYAHAL